MDVNGLKREHGVGMAAAGRPAVSRGVKLLLIAALALVMSLLALFVDSMTSDRR